MDKQEIYDIIEDRKEELFDVGFSIVHTISKNGELTQLKHSSGRVYTIGNEYFYNSGSGESGIGRKLYCIDFTVYTLNQVNPKLNGYSYLSLESVLTELIETFENSIYFL